jgi:hypothetical protein
VDLNHRPRPYQECGLRHVFAAIIGVRGFDPLTSSLLYLVLVLSFYVRSKQPTTEIERSSGRIDIAIEDS